MTETDLCFDYPKHPDAKATLTFVFPKVIAAGELIEEAEIESDDLDIDQDSITVSDDGKEVSCLAEGGEDGTFAVLTITVTTDSGQSLPEDIKVFISKSTRRVLQS